MDEQEKIAGLWEMIKLDDKIIEVGENRLRAIIKAIIKTQGGMRTYFRETLSRKGDGTSRVYVRASKYNPDKKGSIVVDLGNIEMVKEWTPRELIEKLNRKFAEKVKTAEEKIKDKCQFITRT